MATFKPNLTPVVLFCATFAAVAPYDASAQAPAPPAAAAPVLTPDALNALWDEAAKAFSANPPNYTTAAEKISTILNSQAGKSKSPTIELLRFNLGFAYLLDKKFPEAEAAFTDCLRQFPAGEYASRCALGVGQARFDGATSDEGKKSAIEPLRKAAADPKYRSQAGLLLGRIYNETGQEGEALKVFRTLMGSDIRTPSQTIAAVEVVDLLAGTEKLDDLIPYLDRLIRQTGIRDAIAWYTLEVVTTGDKHLGQSKYDAALALYRSVLPRAQVLEIQKAALEDQKKEVKRLTDRVAAEEKLPLDQRTNANELLGSLKTAVETTEKALTEIETGKAKDLDAVLLMSRGRCLYYLNRYEEALLTFRTLRTKYPTAAKDIQQSGAYAEIAILHTLDRTADLVTLATAYLTKYPDASNSEAVGKIVGEALIKSEDWKKVYEWFKGLSEKFPNSPDLTSYMAAEGAALMSDGQFADAAVKLGELLKKSPSKEIEEDSLYRIAMCYFLTNNFQETLNACNEYLSKYPNGKYAGDVLYRLSFIDFQNPKKDKADVILDRLGKFIESHKNDLSVGAMSALIGDVWSQQKKGDTAEQKTENENMALEYYLKAVWAEAGKAQGASDEVIKYALEAATSIYDSRKDNAAIVKLHGEFIEKYPRSKLAMNSVNWVAKILIREKKYDETVKYLAPVLKERIGNPAEEDAEYLIDTLLRALVPKIKKPTPEDADKAEATVVQAMEQIVGKEQNPTANARMYFARALIRQKFRDIPKSDLYISGIATSAKPEDLSPYLLDQCAGYLLKMGELDKAEEMYRRLRDRYQESFFSDAGPLGLGEVAIARKQYKEAVELLDAALSNKSSSKMYQAIEAKARALIMLKDYQTAEDLLVKELIGVRDAPKDLIARAYLDRALIARMRSKDSAASFDRDQLQAADAHYGRVIIAYKAIPEVFAEAHIGKYEVLKELSKPKEADETLDMLLANPKYEKTEGFKKARALRGR